MCRFKKWQNAWWYASNLNIAKRSSKVSSISCALRFDGGSGGPTSRTSCITSSDKERKISSLASRSCLTQSLRSSSRLGCGSVVEKVGDVAALGIGIGHLPSQYFHVPLAWSANLMLRRHREYSGPVKCDWSCGTPGRRVDVVGDIVVVRRQRRRAGQVFST